MTILQRVALACVLIASSGSAATGQTTLPDDSQDYHVVLVTADPPSPACRALVDAFKAEPTLAAIAGTTKLFTFKTSDPLYRERYAEALGGASPVVALVRSDGGVLYKASGPNVPPADTLAAQILAMGRADQKQNPRAETDTSGRVPRRPVVDGSRLIPDTVNVSPTVNVAPSVGYWIAGAVLVFVLGFVLVALVAAVAFVLIFKD